MPEKEWLRIMTMLRQVWPDEKLPNAELFRRCMILGVRVLPHLSAEAAKQYVAIYRNYTPPIDGTARPTIHAEPEAPSDETNFRS